jgi:4-hydroxybenzoyl-CoA thioesterase
MKSLVQHYIVDFSDCDPARIVFYPRYFEWFDRGTERLFRSLGMPWATLFGTPMCYGLPILDAHANFKRPSRFGDTIEIETRVGEWRGKTFLMQHEIRNRGELAVEGQELRAWTVPDPSRPVGFRAAPVPEDVIARFQD